MAETPNPTFSNGTFTGDNSDKSFTDLPTSDASEVLATQANITNSLKTFWNRLRKKLAFTVTRTNTSEGVGNARHPVYVNNAGQAAAIENTATCETAIATQAKTASLSLYPGLTVKVTFTNGTQAKTTTSSYITLEGKGIYYLNGDRFDKNLQTGSTLSLYYDGDKFLIMDTLEQAATNSPGLVKLGADGVTSLATPSATNTSGRYYPVQTDSNNKLVVNVPWQVNTDTHYSAGIVANGNAAVSATPETNSTNVAKTSNGVYIHIVDKDGAGTAKKNSSIKLVGGGMNTVTSDANGNVTITATHLTTEGNKHIPSGGRSGKILGYLSPGTAAWLDPPSYNILKTTDRVANNATDEKYVVNGPGEDKADVTHFLCGTGAWVTATATIPRLAASVDISNKEGIVTGNVTLSVNNDIQIIALRYNCTISSSSSADTSDALITKEFSAFNSKVFELGTFLRSSLSWYNTNPRERTYLMYIEAISKDTLIRPAIIKLYFDEGTWKASVLTQ